MIATLPAVKKFLQASPLKMLIGGKWIAAANGKTFTVRDPGDGAVIARAPDGRAVDVDRAVRAADGPKCPPTTAPCGCTGSLI
jgi:hypothetical protein